MGQINVHFYKTKKKKKKWRMDMDCSINEEMCFLKKRPQIIYNCMEYNILSAEGNGKRINEVVWHHRKEFF